MLPSRRWQRLLSSTCVLIFILKIRIVLCARKTFNFPTCALHRQEIFYDEDVRRALKTVVSCFVDHIATDMLKQVKEEMNAKVLDIGSGLGLYNMELYDELKSFGLKPNMHLYNINTDSEFGGFIYTQQENGKLEKLKLLSFNSSENGLKCAKRIMEVNRIPPEDVQIHYDVDSMKELPSSSFWLAYSLLSMGTHYSINAYWKDLSRILKPGGVVIFHLKKDREFSRQVEVIKKSNFECFCAGPQLRNKLCMKLTGFMQKDVHLDSTECWRNRHLINHHKFQIYCEKR